MHFVDPDQVLDDFVSRWLKQVGTEKFQQELYLGVDGLKSLLGFVATEEFEALLGENVRLKGREVNNPLLLELVEARLADVEACLIVNIGCLLDVEQERDPGS